MTSDDEDYIDPYENRDDENAQQTKMADSVSEVRCFTNKNIIYFTFMLTIQDHSEPHSDSVVSSAPDRPKANENKKYDSKLSHRKLINKSSRNVIPPIFEQHQPTDISDSSDSENGKNIPFISTAECNSMHEGRQLVHTILPINVDTLMSLLFSKSSK